MSREHIWSMWTQKLYPKDPSGRHENLTFSNSPSERKPRLADRKSFQGDVTTLKIKAVCKQRCNNGWMSRLEERAIPLLTKLMKREPCVLGPDEQALLSAWIIMKTMVIEYGSTAVPLSKQHEREHVRDTQTPPNHGWQVWIAAHEGRKWKSGLMRQTAGLAFAPEGSPPPEFGSVGINIQFVLLGLGQLIFVVCANQTHRELGFPDNVSHIIRRIWPTGPAVRWPPIVTLTDAQIDTSLTSALSSFLDAAVWVSGM